MAPGLALLRPPIALLLALLFTAAMFWFLARMIDAPIDAGGMSQATRIEFTRMRRDSEVVSKREELKKVERERTPEIPSTPRMSMDVSTTPSGTAVSIAQPRVDTSGIKMNLSAGGSDRGVAPLVRVNPDYPRRALERGIEGWVHVRFTITAAGTVKDLVVVDSEPKGVFDEAASKAVLRWRYNPKVENGVAVERVGEQTLIRFKLEE